MPEEIGAFANARDTVQAIAARLATLGQGADAQLAALAARLGTLPASARFAPFGEPGALAQALGGDSAQPVDGAEARKRSGGSRSAPAKPNSGKASRAGTRWQAPVGAIGAALAGDVAGGRRNVEPQLAAALLAEPVLEAMTALARLTGNAPARKTPIADSPLAVPAAVAQHVAQWMAGQLEQAATPLLDAPGSASFGTLVADMLASQDLIARSLAGLGKPVRRDPKRGSAASKSADATAVAVPAQPANGATARTRATEPAPRAPSKLLPPGAETPPTATAAADRADAPRSAPDSDDDAITAMTRSLIDQAWLRGVDLR